MCYETDDSSVLASDPYLHAVNHPSSWIKEVRGHSKNIVRGIYALVSSVGEKPPTEAPHIIVLKFNAKLKGVLIESGSLLIRYDDVKLILEENRVNSGNRLPTTRHKQTDGLGYAIL